MGTACNVPAQVSLSRNEYFPLPLQPVVNYRRRSLDQLAEWLPRDKLYGMPRSLQTQGSRALGRLAYADNQRLQNGIGRQHDRGRVLLFLRDPTVEPTNNVAERMLRPAVIARKVSQCSKNEAGATAYAVLKSLAVTWGLRGLDVAGQFLSLLSPKTSPAQ